jgi:heptosyltransferase-3
MHIVPLILSLLETVAVPPVPRVVSGFDEADARLAREILGSGEYVLLHPYAGRSYKHWPPEHWGELARLIREGTGIEPVFTVSPSSAEGPILERILENSPRGTRTLGRQLSFPQLSAVLSRGRALVGVDTVATHMAAALDVPTVALYGPSMTRHWGPWPNDSSDKSPYAAHGGLQRLGRITVIQKGWPCVPCNRETCALSGGGRIECMEAITPEEVCAELRLALAAAAPDQDAAGGPR